VIAEITAVALASQFGVGVGVREGVKVGVKVTVADGLSAVAVRSLIIAVAVRDSAFGVRLGVGVLVAGPSGPEASAVPVAPWIIAVAVANKSGVGPVGDGRSVALAVRVGVGVDGT
jgi:hypothetical protein